MSRKSPSAEKKRTKQVQENTHRKARDMRETDIETPETFFSLSQTLAKGYPQAP